MSAPDHVDDDELPDADRYRVDIAGVMLFQRENEYGWSRIPLKCPDCLAIKNLALRAIGEVAFAECQCGRRWPDKRITAAWVRAAYGQCDPTGATVPDIVLPPPEEAHLS